MYDGTWKFDKFEGQGTYVYKIGERYVGMWKDGKKHGQGTYYWRNGASYEGQWKDDLRNGEGTYRRKHATRKICYKPQIKKFGPEFMGKVKLLS